MKTRRVWLVLLGAAALLGNACERSSPPRPAPDDGPVQATLSTNVIRVGDVATLSLSWVHAMDTVPRFPDLNREREVVVLGVEEHRTVLADDQVRTVLDVKWTSFRPGAHQMYTGQVTGVTSAGVTNRYAFPEVSFEVASVLAGDEDLRPPKSVRTWPGSPWPWIIALLIAGLCAAAAVAGYVYVRRRQGMRPTPAPAPLPADVVARRALARLEARGYIEALMHEPFYVELSGIVRRYLEDRFSLHAPEQTTEEFIREAASFQGLDPDQRRLTGDFLEQSDLVKFARHRPSREDMENAFGAGERLVEETRLEGPSA